MQRLQLRKDLAALEAEGRVYKSLEEKKNAGRMASILEKEKLSLPLFLPISMIPVEIKDEKEPFVNI